MSASELTTETSGCWFCGRSQADPAHGLPVKLHYTESVKPFDYGATAGYEHRFRETTVSVPRCNRCKDVHERWKQWATKGGMAGLVLWPVLWLGSCVAALIIQGASFLGALGAGLFLFIPLLLGGMTLGAIVGWLVPRPAGVKGVGHGRKHPAVAKMREQGWMVSSNQDYYRSNIWE